ncbi:MAG: hypothetical protein KGV44_06255 [Flavobacteriaceae bacterium]|nr:hypothetical protein [Flavobacteriaceae bacterium]
MKYSTINLGNNSIEIHNSAFGKETIKVNNKIVSSKRSLRGAEHTFSIMENNKEVKCKISLGYGRGGVTYDFYKGNEPIIVSSKDNLIPTILIISLCIITIGIISRFI